MTATATPEWRTLRGIITPFQVLVVSPNAETLRTAYGRGRPAGTAVTITELHSCFYGRASYGVTADGRTVSFGGHATHMWVIQ